MPSDTLEEEIDGVERPEQAFERREGLRTVMAAVSALPQRQRDAIVLRELEGRSYDEIAASSASPTAPCASCSTGRAPRCARASPRSRRWGCCCGSRSAADEPLTERIAELTAAGRRGHGGGQGGRRCRGGRSGDRRHRRRPRDRRGDLLPPAVRGAVAEAGDEVAEAAVADAEDGRRARRHPALGLPDEGDGRGDRRAARRRLARGADDRSGHGGCDDSNSGPGSGGDRSGTPAGPARGTTAATPAPAAPARAAGDNSGPGSGGDDMLADDNSGSGSSGSGSSGSGSSGSGSSGSGTSGSGSGSSGSGSDDLERSGSNSGSG